MEGVVSEFQGQVNNTPAKPDNGRKAAPTCHGSRIRQVRGSRADGTGTACTLPMNELVEPMCCAHFLAEAPIRDPEDLLRPTLMHLHHVTAAQAGRNGLHSIHPSEASSFDCIGQPRGDYTHLAPSSHQPRLLARALTPCEENHREQVVASAEKNSALSSTRLIVQGMEPVMSRVQRLGREARKRWCGCRRTIASRRQVMEAHPRNEVKGTGLIGLASPGAGSKAFRGNLFSRMCRNILVPGSGSTALCE